MIYKNPEPFNKGKLMEGIFDYQKCLMAVYEEKGMIPKLPININDRAHQSFIKSTIADVIEELAEADSAYDPIKHSMVNDDLRKLIGKLNEPLIEYTNELADALHFFVELLICVGIDANEMLDYYKVTLEEKNLSEALMTEDALLTSMRYARHINITETPILHLKQQAYKVINQSDYEKLHIGGWFLHPELIPFFDSYNWSVTKNLKLAGHKLKKKAWRVKEIETELRPFYSNIMEAWIYFTLLLDMIGMDEKSIYTRYEKKNIINQERAESKY